MIDPIDGTVNFLYGLPQYAVSIAAEVDGVVVAGVVLNIATGVEFTAYADQDGVVRSRRDGEPIRVRATVPLGQRLVSTGFSYDAHLRGLQARALVELIPQVRDIRRLGSCALDLCHVAEGTLDGYLEEGVNLWDHAAGGLVAQGAGATVEVTTGVGGRRLVLCAPADGFDDPHTHTHTEDCGGRFRVPSDDGSDDLDHSSGPGIDPGHRLFMRRNARRCVTTGVDGAQSGAPTPSDPGRRFRTKRQPGRSAGARRLPAAERSE